MHEVTDKHCVEAERRGELKEMIQNLKLTGIELNVSLICVTLTVSYTYTQTTDINHGLISLQTIV